MRKHPRRGTIQGHPIDQLEDRRLLSGFQFASFLAPPAYGSSAPAFIAAPTAGADFHASDARFAASDSFGELSHHHAFRFAHGRDDDSHSAPPTPPWGGRMMPPPSPDFGRSPGLVDNGAPRVQPKWSRGPRADFALGSDSSGDPAIAGDASPFHDSPRFGERHGMEGAGMHVMFASMQPRLSPATSDEPADEYMSAASMESHSPPKGKGDARPDTAPGGSETSPSATPNYSGSTPTAGEAPNRVSLPPPGRTDAPQQRQATPQDRPFGIPSGTVAPQTSAAPVVPARGETATPSTDVRFLAALPGTQLAPPSIAQGAAAQERFALAIDHSITAINQVGLLGQRIETGASLPYVPETSGTEIGDPAGAWLTNTPAPIASPSVAATVETAAGPSVFDLPTLEAGLLAELLRSKTSAIQESLDDFLRHYDESSELLEDSSPDRIAPILIITSVVAAEFARRRAIRRSRVVRSESAPGVSSSLKAFS